MYFFRRAFDAFDVYVFKIEACPKTANDIMHVIPIARKNRRPPAGPTKWSHPPNAPQIDADLILTDRLSSVY
jgi:hypothetical protein